MKKEEEGILRARKESYRCEKEKKEKKEILRAGKEPKAYEKRGGRDPKSKKEALPL